MSTTEAPKQTVKFDLSLSNKDAERDYFKICAISYMFSQPQECLVKWKTRNLLDMYRKAKNPVFNQGKDVKFYQFMEWIEKDMNVRSIYNTELRLTQNPSQANGLIHM